MEIWKDIKGYEGIYKISDLGNIKSLPRRYSKGRILKPSKDSKGYLRVALSCNRKVRYDSVHRLVAETFIQNMQQLPEVNHIDGNKLNNSAKNLEWVTKSQNEKHAYKIGLRKVTEKQRNASKENIKIAHKYNHKNKKEGRTM